VTAPIIGICAALETASWGLWTQHAAFLPGDYVKKVQAAGGIPVGLIPDPAVAKDPGILLDRIDGLLLIGGTDVHPGTYGQSVSVYVEPTTPLRDDFELALTRAAFARDFPILGICRGLQIMNIANGGTLHQDLEQRGFTGHRAYPGSLGESTYHAIDIQPETLAARAAGSGTRQVNSHHHQGVDLVAEGAAVTAFAVADGLPEALEWPALRFALGVQWHPEAMPIDDAVCALVNAARPRLAAEAAWPYGCDRLRPPQN
jgi:putative glutamine amidotransferase